MWSWWTISYWVLGIILVVALIAAYVIYRGYLKVKPKPLEGIPAPPLSHAILGHPDKMLHPLRHDLRLGVCDSAGKSPVHQLVLMKHSSVFVDSSLEAGYVMQDAPEKGPMYNMFRFDQAIPDLYASDGDEWKIRSEGLSEALRNIELTSSSLERIKANLISKVEEAAENGTPLDLKELFTLLGFDVICEAAFGYQLDALSGSEQGSKLRASLKTLEDAQAGQGIYASPNARSVPPEEINTAKAEWRAFLDKLLALTQTEGETFTAKHGELQPKRSFRHALLALSAARGEDKYGANEMRGDIHQVLRHGHETLAGTLMWIFFALHRNPDVRLELEKSVQTTTDGGIPLYLDWTLMESMRRHPVVGNMTVRTPTESIKVAGQFEVPPGTPLHLHMYSLQNTQREWKNPRSFLPKRWDPSVVPLLDEWGDEGDVQLPSDSLPRCPFLAEKASKQKNVTFKGAGFNRDCLSYLPFSAGPRSCPGADFSLDIMRRVILWLVATYRFDSVEPIDQEDPGSSAFSTILPILGGSTTVRVSKDKKGEFIGKVAKWENPSAPKSEDDDGWADED